MPSKGDSPPKLVNEDGMEVDSDEESSSGIGLDEALQSVFGGRNAPGRADSDDDDDEDEDEEEEENDDDCSNHPEGQCPKQLVRDFDRIECMAVIRYLVQKEVLTDDEAIDVVEEMDGQFGCSQSMSSWRTGPRYGFLIERLQEEEGAVAMKGKKAESYLEEIVDEVNHDLNKETLLEIMSRFKKDIYEKRAVPINGSNVNQNHFSVSVASQFSIREHFKELCKTWDHSVVWPVFEDALDYLEGKVEWEAMGKVRRSTQERLQHKNSKQAAAATPARASPPRRSQQQQQQQQQAKKKSSSANSSASSSAAAARPNSSTNQPRASAGGGGGGGGGGGASSAPPPPKPVEFGNAFEEAFKRNMQRGQQSQREEVEKREKAKRDAEAAARLFRAEVAAGRTGSQESRPQPSQPQQQRTAPRPATPIAMAGGSRTSSSSDGSGTAARSAASQQEDARVRSYREEAERRAKAEAELLAAEDEEKKAKARAEEQRRKKMKNKKKAQKRKAKKAAAAAAAGGGGGSALGGTTSQFAALQMDSSSSSSDSDSDDDSDASEDAKPKERVVKTEGDLTDDEIPNEYVCPISFNIMTDPTIAADGNTYEREQIVTWIETRKRNRQPITSPLSGDVMPEMLLPNKALRNLIYHFKEKHGLALPSSNSGKGL